MRVSELDVKATNVVLLLVIALVAIACKDVGALSFGGSPIPDAVLTAAIRTHALAGGSGPLENVTIVQVTRASAEKARARVAKGETDDDTRTAAQFAAHLDVSPADAANGVEERIGIVWRGIGRGRDGTARDVRERVVATRFQGGVWAVAGYLFTETGTFAGTGDHAGAYIAQDRSSVSRTFRCEMALAPAAQATFRGTYRCAGRHRDYTYEPYRDVRYEGAIEEFVELAWTPERFRAVRSAPGSCCTEAFFITRAATGERSLVPVEVQKDGDLDVRWHPPSRQEQGPSRTSSWRLTFQETATAAGGVL